MDSISSVRNPFLMLSSSTHPEEDLIYQCRTSLCVKVLKRRLPALQATGSLLLRQAVQEEVYIFQTVDPGRDDESDLQAAIKWYFSYYRLENQQVCQN